MNVIMWEIEKINYTGPGMMRTHSLRIFPASSILGDTSLTLHYILQEGTLIVWPSYLQKVAEVKVLQSCHTAWWFGTVPGSVCGLYCFLPLCILGGITLPKNENGIFDLWIEEKFRCSKWKNALDLFRCYFRLQQAHLKFKSTFLDLIS